MGGVNNLKKDKLRKYYTKNAKFEQNKIISEHWDTGSLLLKPKFHHSNNPLLSFFF